LCTSPRFAPAFFPAFVYNNLGVDDDPESPSEPLLSFCHERIRFWVLPHRTQDAASPLTWRILPGRLWRGELPLAILLCSKRPQLSPFFLHRVSREVSATTTVVFPSYGWLWFLPLRLFLPKSSPSADVSCLPFCVARRPSRRFQQDPVTSFSHRHLVHTFPPRPKAFYPENPFPFRDPSLLHSLLFFFHPTVRLGFPCPHVPFSQ